MGSERDGRDGHNLHQQTLPLALGAVGVVFGDIGTSPLYTMKECFFGIHALPLGESSVLGILSLIFWSLTAVVSFKYLGFVMRADNRGEGGTFALFALLPPRDSRGGVLTFMALMGASLLYGDGMITPAISVLSAMEGLEVATTSLKPAVVPFTIVVLLFLFGLQRRGTAGVGRIFGPVMVLWFLAIAALGVGGIVRNPQVLQAVDPRHAVTFFVEHRFHAFLALGSVVLCLTGAEALYADLGHFGKRPIRLAWFALAFPALLLNYAGQGAVLLAQGPAATHPFYALVPGPLHFPMVIVSTAAAVIASQALISGAFSLTRQAVQLGFMPRVRVIHTSGSQEGQIFIPGINTFLMAACVGLVLAFRESGNLAAAYGVAVTLNMIATSLLFFFVAHGTWRWPLYRTLPLIAVFLLFDLAFFGANIFKVPDGGWFPIVVAICFLAIMSTWRLGRSNLAKLAATRTLPLHLFLEDVQRQHPRRVPGTAVFMAAAPSGTPIALLHHFKHNQTLHEQVVVLSVIISEDRPYVSKSKRIELESLSEGFHRLRAHYGFMETPDVPEAMRLATKKGLRTDPSSTSYFLGRETLLVTGESPMAQWRKVLFQVLSRNAAPATAYFNLPPGRVVEMGMQVEL